MERTAPQHICPSTHHVCTRSARRSAHRAPSPPQSQCPNHLILSSIPFESKILIIKISLLETHRKQPQNRPAQCCRANRRSLTRLSRSWSGSMLSTWMFYRSVICLEVARSLRVGSDPLVNPTENSSVLQRPTHHRTCPYPSPRGRHPTHLRSPTPSRRPIPSTTVPHTHTPIPTPTPSSLPPAQQHPTREPLRERDSPSIGRECRVRRPQPQ